MNTGNLAPRGQVGYGCALVVLVPSISYGLALATTLVGPGTIVPGRTRVVPCLAMTMV